MRGEDDVPRKGSSMLTHRGGENMLYVRLAGQSDDGAIMRNWQEWGLHSRKGPDHAALRETT